jgi:hypothetical protein
MAEKAAEFREKGGEIYLSEDGKVREAIDWGGTDMPRACVLRWI